MKDILALADLQFSRFRSWMPFARGSRPGAVMLIQAVFLLLSLWFFRHWTDPVRLYAGWTFLHLFAVIVFSGSQWCSSEGGVEWGLTVPRPRMRLVMGSALGNLRMGLHLALYMEATVLLHYATALLLHWAPGASVSLFAGVMVTFTLLDLAALVPAVAVGMVRVVFSRGWARVGGVLYYVFLFGLFTGWPLVNRLWDGALPFSTAWKIVLVTVGIGWTLSWFLLRLTAGLGLRRLGDMRLAEAGLGRRLPAAAEPTGTGEARPGRSPFWSLFALEGARYRFWGSGAPPVSRLIFWVTVAGGAAAGYVMMRMSPDMLREWSYVGAGVYAYVLTWAMKFPLEPFHQGWGSWWLAIPRPRWMLLAARWLAVWIALVGIISLSLISLGIGFTIYEVAGGSNASAAGVWGSVAEVWLFVTLLFTVNFLLLQIAPALFGSRPFLLLMPLLYISFFMELGWVGRLMVERQGTGPWPILGLLAGIGLPLGLFCFWLGSRFLHQLLFVENARWRRGESGR